MQRLLRVVSDRVIRDRSLFDANTQGGKAIGETAGGAAEVAVVITVCSAGRPRSAVRYADDFADGITTMPKDNTNERALLWRIKIQPKN